MIRKAKMSDIPQLAEIYRQLHCIHCEIRSDYYKMPDIDFFEKQMKKFMENEELTVFVYDNNSEIMGYAIILYVEMTEPLNCPFRKCLIEQFAVNEKFRRKGIGKKLMNYVKKLAAENNCQSVELGVWCENYNAVEFYSEMGFVPRTYKMEMKIM